jgi:hypothetical protein
MSKLVAEWFLGNRDLLVVRVQISLLVKEYIYSYTTLAYKGANKIIGIVLLKISKQ